MEDLLRLEACHCFASRQAARYVSQIYERHFIGAVITSTQFTVLALLGMNPGASTIALAKALVMDRTTLVRALTPLQRTGLIAEGPRKSRVKTFFPTAKGRETLKANHPLWEAAQLEYETLLGPKRADEIKRMLLALTS